MGDDTFNFQYSQTSLKRIIKSIGFICDKEDSYALVNESETISFTSEYFLRNYIENPKKSSTPNIVVFFNETWLYL